MGVGLGDHLFPVEMNIEPSIGDVNPKPKHASKFHKNSYTGIREFSIAINSVGRGGRGGRKSAFYVTPIWYCWECLS